MVVRKTQRKRTNKKIVKRQEPKLIKYKGFTILVIYCPKPEYAERLKKYDSRYNIRYCYNRDLISDKTISKWKFLWNAKKEHRKKVISCYLSHMQALDYIIKHNLKNVIIIEDDAYIPENRWKQLEKLKNFHSMCYVGGVLGWKLQTKDHQNDIKHFDDVRRKKIGKTFKENRINEIKTEDIWRIGGAFGIFFPHKEEVIKLKKAIEENQKGRLNHPIDNELVFLQKAKIVKYLFFPAIVILYLPEAKKGFTGPYVNSSFERY